MAISIHWPSKVITVPRADMTLIQSNPVEIRELNLNQFRLTLKDLEDDEEGMPFINTHSHNTEVLLGGIVYARIIEIINGYTVTFEDGQYSVNLVGANSNVGDVVNPNQVSVRSANAAGLISNQAIEYSSFNGGVTVDVINGSSGTTFPIGTPQQPVNNIPDAILIANFRGFYKLFIVNDIVLSTGDNVSEKELVGQGIYRTTITVNAASNVLNTKITDATLTGTFDGKSSFERCLLQNISFVEADIFSCILSGEIILDGNGNTIIENCRDGLLDNGLLPVINFNNSDHSLAVRNYHGDINLKNKSGTGNVEINVNSGGRVILENTVSAGNVRITGTVEVVDNSTGTANIDVSNTIFPEFQQLASFFGVISIDTVNGTSGVKFPLGTLQNPSNNLADALLISNERGITKFSIKNTLSIADTDISGLTFEGENEINSVIILSGTGNTTVGTKFTKLQLVGRLEGYAYIEECGIQALSNIGSTVFPTVFKSCILREDLGVTPAVSFSSISDKNIHFIECVSGAPGNSNQASIDFNGTTSTISIRKYDGGLKISNYTGANESSFDFSSGKCILLPSCTNGNLVIRGIGKLEDDSQNNIPTGSWNGMTIINELVTSGEIATTGGVWTSQEKIDLILESSETNAWSKKASDNAEQANLKL